jgi:hypothetical protein
MDAKTLALGTHLLGTIRWAFPEPSPEHVEGLSMGLMPEKQDHSAVVEPSLVRAMALLEAVVEKGVMRDNRVLVELVDRVAQAVREVEYPAGLDAMTAWEKSMAPMDI